MEEPLRHANLLSNVPELQSAQKKHEKIGEMCAKGSSHQSENVNLHITVHFKKKGVDLNILACRIKRVIIPPGSVQVGERLIDKIRQPVQKMRARYASSVHVK